MNIELLVVKNYRALRETTVALNRHLNIIVGDNEAGKSTLLEALNLALSCQLNGRSLQFELHPFLFNAESVDKYIEDIKSGRASDPPEILIELYLNDDAEFARLRGTNNSKRQDCPGISLKIEFDDAYAAEYKEYITRADRIRTVPVEYYAVRWRSFSGNEITTRSIPIRSTLIDASAVRNNLAASRFVLEIMRDHLTPRQRAELSLSYRQMKDQFLADESVKKINQALLDMKGKISDSDLSISLDTTARGNWESGIMPMLDQIPLPLVGKGEQNKVKIKLALSASVQAPVLLVEEPENHLSYVNLNGLIGHIASECRDKQVLITTHSSFVLNKLGVESLLLFNGRRAFTLKDITHDTRDYFLKLPGHDTLRLVLAKKSILVEGPSDELVVQRAFKHQVGCMPLEKGIDVIAVKSLAFKRFLEIAKLLKKQVSVVADNDGNVDALKAKYAEYDNVEGIKIFYDTDAACPTLEPQMLKANSLQLLNKVFGKDFNDPSRLLAYMKANKTDCALKIFNTDLEIEFPDYIAKAISA